MTGHTFCPSGKVDSDDFSHKKWALACANAQNQTHYLSYKPFFSSGKVDSDDFSHKKWALACANAQNQTHYLSYKPKPTLRTPPRKGVPQRMNVALTQMPHTFAPHRANEDSATLRKTKSLLFRTGFRFWMAGCTRLELATSDVTGRRSNQLS